MLLWRWKSILIIYFLNVRIPHILGGMQGWKVTVLQRIKDDRAMTEMAVINGNNILSLYIPTGKIRQMFPRYLNINKISKYLNPQMRETTNTFYRNWRDEIQPLRQLNTVKVANVHGWGKGEGATFPFATGSKCDSTHEENLSNILKTCIFQHNHLILYLKETTGWGHINEYKGCLFHWHETFENLETNVNSH